MRATQSGVPVCTFTVAVNRRRQSAEAGQQETDYFRVTTWRGMAENCNRYLRKGSKAGVTGTLTLQRYTGQDGNERHSMEVQADEVEFLTPKQSGNAPDGFIQVPDNDLPF